MTQAYVAAARQLGAEVYRFTKVDGADASAPDGIWDVVTDKGHVHAEHVVNAGGLWAREVGRMVGLELPVLAMEHHYIVTEAVPELAGLRARDHQHDRLRGRDLPAAGGPGRAARHLRAGLRAVVAATTPDDFHMPAAARRSRPHRAGARGRLPALSRRSGAPASRRSINGPFTFAPDGNPLVGPVQGLPNFWVACAVMAGFSQGGGIGLVLSRWMAEGDPGQDVLAMDVARFGVFATPRYTNIKVQENYRRRFRLAFPNEELPAARPLRRTPVYDRLKAAGAVFGANFGLEHALWFAPTGVEPVEDADLSPLRTPLPHVARRMPGGAHAASASTRPRTTAKYEVTGRGRARLARPRPRLPHAEARAAWRSRRC